MYLAQPVLVFEWVQKQPWFQSGAHVAVLLTTAVLRTKRRWLVSHSTSPKTNAPLEHKRLTPNHALRGAIEQFKERRQAAARQAEPEPEPEPVAPKPITVATYNIAGGQDTFSHERVLGALRSLDADVICLQEVAGHDVGHTQAHRLARDLGMNCVFGNAHQKRLFGNAILSHFPLTLIDEIELPRGSLNRDDGTRMPGQKERRAALAVTVSPFTDVPKYDFLCICTHVGIYNSAEEATKGQEPGRIIGEFVKSETWKDTPALLAGDLNCRWATPFVGVVARLDRNWNIHPSAGTKTRKSDDRKHKIDYICDRGRGTWRMQGGLTHAAGSWTHAVRNESTDPGDGSLPPSDHLPLKAVWVPLP